MRLRCTLYGVNLGGSLACGRNSFLRMASGRCHSFVTHKQCRTGNDGKCACVRWPTCASSDVPEQFSSCADCSSVAPLDRHEQIRNGSGRTVNSLQVGGLNRRLFEQARRTGRLRQVPRVRSRCVSATTCSQGDIHESSWSHRRSYASRSTYDLRGVVWCVARWSSRSPDSLNSLIPLSPRLSRDLPIAVSSS